MGFCVSHNREALVLASIHICISGNCVEMVRWTFSVDVNDMHYIFHPVRGLFSTMICAYTAYLHLAGGCVHTMLWWCTSKVKMSSPFLLSNIVPLSNILKIQSTHGWKGWNNGDGWMFQTYLQWLNILVMPLQIIYVLISCLIVNHNSFPILTLKHI